MSGGHFNYKQFSIEDIASEIEEVISRNNSEDDAGHGQRYCDIYGFSDEIISRFELAVKTLRLAAAMAHRVDWLLSGDDGPESFLERWKGDVGD